MKAMILAAGRGTRLRPFTDHTPKALFPVGKYTLLELTILYLRRFGVNEFVINVHHHAQQIIDYLDMNNGFGLSYTISDETSRLLDTGGAIVHARKYLEGEQPFVMMGIDVLTNLDLGAMLQYHRQKNALVTLAVKDRPTSRSLLFDSDLRLCGWRDNNSGAVKGDQISREKYALGFSVVHILEPGIFNYISEKGEFSITDLYLRLMVDHLITGFRHDNSAWLEFGRAEMIRELMDTPEFRELIAAY
jgi:MurNAc alpha-1-phosphate uridylyltransferase